MKLSLRFFFSIGIFFTLLAVGFASYLVWRSTSELEKVADRMHRANDSLYMVQSIRLSLNTFRRQALLAGIKTRDERLETLEVEEESLKKKSKQLLEIDFNERDREDANIIVQNISAYLRNWHQRRNAGLSGRNLYIETINSYQKAIDSIQELLDRDFDEAQRVQENAFAASESHQANLRVLWAIILILLLGLFIAFYQVIFRPLDQFSKTLRNFAASTTTKVELSSVNVRVKEIETIYSNFEDMRSRLKDQSEQRLTFLASIAHDLKNPLSALNMSLDLLTEENAPQQRAEVILIMMRQIGQLRRLVDDLLDTTRIEAGKIDLELIDFDLLSVVKDAIKLFQSTTRSHNLILTRPPRNEVQLHGDRHRIGQVLNNLLSNAIKYSPDGGDIEIKIEVAMSSATLEVADHGVGIPQADIPKIFEPFHRSKAARHDIPGVGLGLSTSLKIIQSHRGTIEVESVETKGTRVSVVLPIEGSRENTV